MMNVQRKFDSNQAQATSRWLSELCGLLLLCFLFVGCEQQGDTCETPEETVTDFDFTAEVSEHVTTVIEVEWTSEVPCAGYVEYGIGENYPWRTALESEASTDHKALLLGLRSDTTYPFRLVCIPDDCSKLVSPGQEATTGLLPPNVVKLEATRVDINPNDSRHYIVPLLGINDDDTPGQPVVILDSAGGVVWYHLLPPGTAAPRARISHDGQSVLFNPMDGNFGQGGADTYIRRVALDGTFIEDISVPYLHHDFEELPDGTIAGLSRMTEELAPNQYISWGVIMEVSPEGETEIVFSGGDPSVQEDLVGLGPYPTSPEPPEPGSFINIPTSNAITYDVAEDAYYTNLELSPVEGAAPGQRVLFRFDRSTREVAWVVGGPRGTIDTGPSGSPPWVNQHGTDTTEDGIVVFANTLPEEDCSAIIEVRIDQEAKTAEPIWTYKPEPCRFVAAMGSVERRPNGNTVAFWTSKGMVDEVSPSGELLFSGSLEFGFGLGYGEVIEGFIEH